jgi:hypothetical protein
VAIPEDDALPAVQRTQGSPAATLAAGPTELFGYASAIAVMAHAISCEWPGCAPRGCAHLAKRARQLCDTSPDLATDAQKGGP